MAVEIHLGIDQDASPTRVDDSGLDILAGIYPCSAPLYPDFGIQFSNPGAVIPGWIPQASCEPDESVSPQAAGQITCSKSYGSITGCPNLVDAAESKNRWVSAAVRTIRERGKIRVKPSC